MERKVRWKMLLKTSLSQRPLLTAKGGVFGGYSNYTLHHLCLFKGQLSCPSIQSHSELDVQSTRLLSVLSSFRCRFYCSTDASSYLYLLCLTVQGSIITLQEEEEKKMLRHHPLIFLKVSLSLLFQSVLSHDQQNSYKTL